MRNKVALGISIIFNAVVVVLLLQLRPPPRSWISSPVMSLVFEEEEVLQEEVLGEPVPFAAYDQSQFKGMLIEQAFSGLPRKDITEVPVDNSYIKTIVENDTVGIQSEEIIQAEPRLIDNLFIPGVDTILSDLPEAEVTGITGSGVVSGEEEITWADRQRTAVEIIRPEFPAILLKQGMEVDLVVQIVVSPAGRVIEVSILQSSGFPAIDMEVSRALGNWLFEPADSTENDTGLVPVHYRLKKSGL